MTTNQGELTSNAPLASSPMDVEALVNRDILQTTQAEDTSSRLMLLLPELRRMIFSFAIAEEDIVVTEYNEPALLRVSKQLRSEAREAWFQEAEVIISVGSNFVDRARLRNQPGSFFDLKHIKQLRQTTGLIDIDYHTSSFLKKLRPEITFRHVKFQIYNEASMKRTRYNNRRLRKSLAQPDSVRYRILRDRKSLMLASLSLSYVNGRLHFSTSRGESHPGAYTPKPTMRPRSLNLYDACDVTATMKVVLLRVTQDFRDKKFEGFTIRSLEWIASAFLFLTPRARLQDAIIRVMEMQASKLDADRCECL